MESNPTHLDDMLNDYSSKVSELEQEIDGLKNTIADKDTNYEILLSRKTIAQLNWCLIKKAMAVREIQ